MSRKLVWKWARVGNMGLYIAPWVIATNGMSALVQGMLVLPMVIGLCVVDNIGEKLQEAALA